MKNCYLISIEGDVRGENNVGVLGQASQVGVVTESLLETTTFLMETATLAAEVRTNNEISVSGSSVYNSQRLLQQNSTNSELTNFGSS
jgi:hypothetical protein